MKPLTVKSPAKVNLCLYVNFRRDDGYHDISSVMIPVTIYDILDFTLTDSPAIEVFCHGMDIPGGKENIAYKSAEILQREYSVKKGVKIDIYKNIPAGAGLGGGSSNGATVFNVLNGLWDLNLSGDELYEMGKRVGADIPFFINGLPSFIGGIGDVVKNIVINYDIWFLIVCPDIFVSTKYIYNHLNLRLTKASKDIKGFLSLIEREGVSPRWASGLVNDLEKVTISRHKEIGDIKDFLKNSGAIASLMSGSGSAVFGLFSCEKDARFSYTRAMARYENVYLAKGINNTFFNRSQQWK